MSLPSLQRHLYNYPPDHFWSSERFNAAIDRVNDVIIFNSASGISVDMPIKIKNMLTRSEDESPEETMAILMAEQLI